MEKIKYFLESDKGKDLLTIIILVLVGLGSFGLGRLSKSEKPGLKIDFKGSQLEESTPISSNNAIQANDSIKSSNKTSGNYFASIRGSKYYTVSCSAGKSIKAENRIYFASAIDAQQAGYELSSSCR